MKSPWIQALRSVALTVPDLAAAETFYTRVWQLEVADRAPGVLYLRGSGADHHLLALHEAAGHPRIRLVTLRARSAEALAGLSEADARRIVAYMRLIKVSEGQVLTREGEAATNGFMLLVIDGEVTVEGITAGRAEPVVLSVLGPGHLIGETALLDGGPRTATCIATTPLIGAGLSRNALRRLLTADPEVAARLLAAVGRRMAEIGRAHV